MAKEPKSSDGGVEGHAKPATGLSEELAVASNHPKVGIKADPSDKVFVNTPVPPPQEKEKEEGIPAAPGDPNVQLDVADLQQQVAGLIARVAELEKSVIRYGVVNSHEHGNITFLSSK